MSPLILKGLQDLLCQLQGELEQIKSELASDPTGELIKIQAEFFAFLGSTQGLSGSRTTSEAMAFTKTLADRERRQKERLETYDIGRLQEGQIELEQAVAELNCMINREEAKAVMRESIKKAIGDGA